jgi:hypothetical protein
VRSMPIVKLHLSVCFYFALALAIDPAAASSHMQDPDEPAQSAVREPDENWDDALWRNAPGEPADVAVRDARSAESVARPYRTDFDVSRLPEWTGTAEELLRVFREVMDERLYVQTGRPQFKRRSTWLYPYDGCYARAAHMAIGFGQRGLPRPGKVFAFGNLKFSTSFGPKGTFYWSYHVAPAFLFAGKAYILDPAANPNEPIRLERWVAMMSAQPTRIRLSICETEAYIPRNRCFGGSRTQERSTANHHQRFLQPEWSRVANAGHDPWRWLGENPPWKIQPVLFFPFGTSISPAGFPNTALWPQPARPERTRPVPRADPPGSALFDRSRRHPEVN